MIKEIELTKKIEKLKEENQVKLNNEIKRTMEEFKKNKFKVENKTNGEIDVKVNTNKRSIAVGGSLVALNVAIFGFAAYKINKSLKARRLNKEKLLEKQNSK